MQFGPAALTTTLTTNIFNPPTITGGVGAAQITNTVAFVSEIHVVNKHASTAATFNLYRDSTGGNTAGKELAFTTPVPVGGEVVLRYNPPLRFEVSDFLVGGSNTATALTITGVMTLLVCK